MSDTSKVLPNSETRLLSCDAYSTCVAYNTESLSRSPAGWSLR